MTLRLLPLLVLIMPGCKPAEEPPRAGAVGDAWSATGVSLAPPRGTVVVGNAAPAGEAEAVNGVVAPVLAEAAPAGGEAARIDDPFAAAEPSGGGDDGGGAAAPPPGADHGPADEGLSDELVAQVRAPVDDAAMRKARALNRTGLAQHRRLELDAAIRDYEAALAAWPGHPFSRYNLACAYALTARVDAALHHLSIVAAIGDDTARERLRAARVDPDFEALHGVPRFAALTGYAPVRVTWSSTRPRRDEARALVTRLIAAQLPARASAPAGEPEMTRDTLFVRDSVVDAEDLAGEVRRAAGLSAVDLRYGSVPAGREPLVLVLAGAPRVDPTGDNAEGEPEARREPLRSGSPAAGIAGAIGQRLQSRAADGRVDKLQLKATGFFSWETRHADGRSVRRTGRYSVRGDTLALDYRVVSEGPPGASEAELTVEEGQHDELVVAPLSDGLRLGALDFTR